LYTATFVLLHRLFGGIGSVLVLKFFRESASFGLEQAKESWQLGKSPNCCPCSLPGVAAVVGVASDADAVVAL